MIRPGFRESLEAFKSKVLKRIAELDAAARQRADVAEFDKWASTPNGSARLVAFHDAVLDTADTLEAVDRAIADEHYEEARRLIAIGHESLTERLSELKELL